MLAGLLSIFIFLQQYIVPIVFAIGVICFLYGAINSFLLDRGDLGHPFLLRSLMLFTVSIIIYLILSACIVLVSTDFTNNQTGTDTNTFGAEFERKGSVLPTPNTPRRNE